MKWMYGFMVKPYGWVHNISIGHRCVFMGMPLFKREKKSFIKIGNGCVFRSRRRWSYQVGVVRPCTIQTLRPRARLVIGDSCGFSGTVIASAESITLGEHVMCGANVVITDTDWHYTDPVRRSDPNPPSCPIRIGNNVWMGMNVIVLKGVTIGDNTVIAAGSVVTSSLPANVIAGGHPARVIRNL